MPIKAYMKDKSGIPVFANKVGIADKNQNFICCTDDCNAKMILCAAGTDGAYFRSKDKKEHVSSDCIKNSIVFKPDKYNEDMFNLDFAFESMLGKNHSIKTINRGTTGTKKGTVGSHSQKRIHTLPVLYAMCISKAKTGTYNKILIDDIFADGENYSRYGGGIEGYKIVETSFYYYTDSEMSMTLNYPINNKGLNSWVKIKFTDKNLYISQKQKLWNSLHIEPVIIAGEWELAAPGSKHHSECVISKRTQIYYADMK